MSVDIEDMQLTNRTVSFKEGSNSISDHVIFEDESGTEFIHEPGATVNRWLKLADITKERHDRVKFLQDAAKSTNVSADPVKMAAAYAHTSANQRVVNPKPLKILDSKTGTIRDNA